MDAPGAQAPAADTKGTDGVDTFLVDEFTLKNFDTVVGGAGDDILISTTKLTDDQFTTVSSVEVVKVSNTAANQLNELGAMAAAAGVKSVSVLGAAQTINLTGFNKDVTVNGTSAADTVTVSLADAGNKTLNLGNETTNVDILNVTVAAGAAAGSVQFNFTSGSVGNGTSDNATIVGANGKIVVNDESVQAVSTVQNAFNVVGLLNGAVDPAQNRGNFTAVVLGSSANDLNLKAEEAIAGVATGNVYVNAGAGDDTISANAIAGAAHFIVGGAGKDTLNIITAAAGGGAPAGKVSAIAGTGDDIVNVTNGAGVENIILSVPAGSDAGNNIVTYTSGLTLNTANAANNDTLTGGNGRDTLVATSAQLTFTPVANAVQSITGFEAITVSDAQTATTLVTSNIQAGIDTVNLNGSAVAISNVTFDGGVAATLNLGAQAGGNITVASAGTGTADQITVNNATAAADAGNPAVKTAVDVFATNNLTATGVETLVLDGTGTGAPAAGKQTIATLELTGTDLDGSGPGTARAKTTAKFVGSVAFEVANIKADVVDASLLTAGLKASTASLDVTGGSGNDDLTFTGNTVAASAPGAATVVAAVNATINGGDGNDKITINTNANPETGAGIINVNGGAGNDTLVITNRATAKLNVNLGDGADILGSGNVVNATDTIDAGAGTDTLLLSLVGASNVGAFSNFEVFDTVGLNKTLDVDILATKNTVTEFIASGDVLANAALTNVGAGIGFRATGNMGTTNSLTLTQKTAGALTVTLDADQTGTDTSGADSVTAKVNATNATTVNVVFDTSYLANITGDTAPDISNFDIDVAKATSISVTSGGANSFNDLDITGAAELQSVTVTGSRNLDLSVTGGVKLTNVDASAATGGLKFSLADFVANEGTVKLGSGVDVITASAAASNALSFDSLVGFEKTAAVAVSTASADAAAAAAAKADADVLVIANASVADANANVTSATLSNGVLTFTGAGPGSLNAAIAIADAFANTSGEAVLFSYLNDSYVFVQGATHTNAMAPAIGAPVVNSADIVVKLVGITGVTNFAEVATTGATADNFFIV